MTEFYGRTIMITGASKGLGRALALEFAGKGADLAICARNEEQLLDVKKEAERYGVRVLAVSADISLAAEAERFTALALAEFKKIDVLINNASILGPSPIPQLLDFPEDDFFEVIRVNALSAFLITKRVLPGMLERNSGSVINVTSEAGNTGYAGWGAYGISKFAVEGLTETWADELSGTAVRMNMVDPGEMNTDMHDRAVPDCDYELAEPEQVLDVFLYLASDRSMLKTGSRYAAQEFREEEEA
ncbi:SDR family NAD(P)-dependent oxidoreductase [Peribacillus sp. SCS-37]|uniref:SDR family NAD(P)-dependent oxidoreductase n=1 Tax=Paraperibacillus esterisolvens TaxID=3115296 RepID=UPI003905B209